MNDRNYLVTNNLLDKLPLFATDIEIAVAIVGKARAERWRKERLPTLERKGFPAVDAFHDGRAVPLVRKFYEAYFGITAGFAMAKPDGEEKIWQPKNRRKSALAEADERHDKDPTAGPRLTPEEKRAEARANSDAWAAKKKKALEEFRAKKAAETR
ncbi:hypothetical protein [Allomesorhizobium camelthorni]|uniref:hypothetical protein n=1 Tax=Allomesorhizobium camelthorni TaxID=475069 RepID=UPI001FE6B496|nr:hypothetical protein [Mesorhizobium camelthorni]